MADEPQNGQVGIDSRFKQMGLEQTLYGAVQREAALNAALAHQNDFIEKLLADNKELREKLEAYEMVDSNEKSDLDMDVTVVPDPKLTVVPDPKSKETP